MMRGMFAAISGLKNHQVMLDVTANDIANVNTIGYKSARTTFKDSLNQLQRGASGPGGGAGGANAAQVGLGVTLGSIDNLMRAARCSRRATCSTSRSTAPASSGSSTSDGDAADPRHRTFEYTRAGNFTTNADGYLLTQDGYYVQGQDAGGAAHAAADPGRLDQRRHRPERRGHLRRRRGHARLGGLPVAGHVPELGRPRAHRLQPLARRPPTRATRRSAAPARVRLHHRRARSRCPTWTSPRRSRNMITAQRGFQANSRVISTSRRDAAGPGEPEALDVAGSTTRDLGGHPFGDERPPRSAGAFAFKGSTSRPTTRER